MFLLITPFSLLKGECKYYRVTWTEITINSSCYVDSDGGGLEDPTINVYCEDGTTLNYSSEWEINIPNTGTFPIPPVNWAFCSDTNEFLLGPIPEGVTSIDFFLEFFESDDNNCIDHADGIDNCITTGTGTLDLTPGIGQLSINGNTDVYFGFNLEEVGEVIEGINVGEPQCLPNNSYEIEIEVSYNFMNFCNLFPDSSPDLIVNGNSFAITGSPQNVILNLPSDGNIVDIAISLSDNGCEKIFLDAFTAPAIPDVIINAPNGYTLNCIIYPISLDAIGSTGDFPLYYNWSTSEINSSISVNTPGSYQLTITSNFGCTAEASALVVLDIIDPVAIILSDQDTLNCNFSQINLDGSFSSGEGIITYLWSNGETTSSITVDNAGLYTLTVTDIINGCSNSSDITVWEDTLEPSISLELPDGDTINCSQTNLDIISNSIDMSLTYSWNTGEITQSINVVSPGDYQLTVSSSNGCTNSANTIIFADNTIPDLVFQLPQGNILNCNNPDIIIDAQASTGVENIIFNWGNGSIDTSINVILPGYYVLTITDTEGCAVIDSVEIFEDSSIPEIIFSTPPEDTLDCYQTTINLDASLSLGDSTLLFEWSSGQNQNTININSAGTYYLTITQANGCIDIDSFEIYENIETPPIEIDFPNGQTLNCIQSVIILDANNSIGIDSLNFQWSNGKTTPSITVDNSGLYTLTITDINNGCSNSTDITVWEDTLEPSISLELPDGDTINCNKTNLDIFSNSMDMSLLYSWNTGEASQNINVASPGIYQLTVSSSNGCTNSADTIIFADNIIPDLIFQLPQGNILNCIIQNITIDAQASTGEGNLIFNWENGVIDASINVDQSGYYILTITDAKGCSVIDSIEIIEDISTPEIIFSTPPIDTLDCSQTMITLDASLSLGNSSLLFDWSSGQSQNTIDINSAGTYYLTITQANGCIDIDSFKIYETLETPLIEIDFPVGQMLNCIQSVVIINANNSSGSNNLDFLWSTGESTEKIMVLDPGPYSLTVTDINGCTSSTTLDIIEDTINPEATIVTPLGSIIDCTLDSVVLDASLSQSQGTLEYSWNLISTDSTVAVNTPGIYYVTITDINGCSDTASIGIDKITDFIVEYQTESPSCKEGIDGKIIISEISGGSPPYFYQIDNSPLAEVTNTPIVIQNLGNPEYNLTITDNNNCIFEDTVIIPEGNESFVESGDDLTIDLGDGVTIQLNTNITNPFIIWSPSGTIQEISELEFLLSPEISTTYIIDISNENGCQATDQITVYIKAPKNNIYTPNVFSPSSNNAKNKKFTFLGNFQNIKTVKTFSIYDRWGNQMYDITNSTDFNEIGWDGLMNNQRAAPGVYVFHIVIEYKDGDIESLIGDVLLLR